MSNPNNNRWKKLRRKPSSTAGARNALALLRSIDEGAVPTLTAEKADFCHGIGKIPYLCSVQLLQQAYRCTPITADRHFLCPVSTDMRSCNPVPEQKCPAACCKLDNGKCWTVFYFSTSTSNSF
jgi:hypothetical protein